MDSKAPNTEAEATDESLDQTSENSEQAAAQEKQEKEARDYLKDFRIKQLESKVQEYENRIGDIREYVKRMEGELAQIRERTERETEKAIESKQSEFLNSLLEVLDQVELCARSVDNDKGPVAEGVRLVKTSTDRFLKRVGLERIPTVQEAFNPEIHEAISVQPVDDAALDGQVLIEAKAGFRFNGKGGLKVLRPAQVVVGRA